MFEFLPNDNNLLLRHSRKILKIFLRNLPIFTLSASVKLSDETFSPLEMEKTRTRGIRWDDPSYERPSHNSQQPLGENHEPDKYQLRTWNEGQKLFTNR
jgi:hypothetical protein